MLITHSIGGLLLRTDSDLSFPHLKRGLYCSYLAESNESSDISIKIWGYNPKELPLPPLNQEECSRVARSIAFQQRWQNHKVFREPEIRQALQRGMKHPEMMHVSLAWNRVGVINYELNEYNIFYPPEKRAYFFDPLLIAGFRNLFATFLPNFSSLMIHGAGVIYRNKCAIFLAPDEGGKTTVADSLPDGHVLSDDNLILRKENGTMMVHSTPFGQLGNGPSKGELHGIFLLEKSSQFGISPLSSNQLFSHLWEERPFLRSTIPPNMRKKYFDLLYQICHSAPIYKMKFEKDDIKWDEISSLLERQ